MSIPSSSTVSQLVSSGLTLEQARAFELQAFTRGMRYAASILRQHAIHIEDQALVQRAFYIINQQSEVLTQAPDENIIH